LFYGNGRAQTQDIIYLWFFHSAHKLPGITAQTFYIAPLAFCKKGVKYKTAFPGSGNTGNNRKTVVLKSGIHASQVMLAGIF
jgi:hypothetical protein